jgi:hypothetical protein
VNIAAGDGLLPDWCVEAGLTVEQYRQSLRTPPDFASVEAVDRWMTPEQAAKTLPWILHAQRDGLYYDMKPAVLGHIAELAKRAGRPAICHRVDSQRSPRSRARSPRRRRTQARPGDDSEIDPSAGAAA